MRNNSSISNNMEEKFLNSKLYSQSSRIKSPLSSVMPQYSLLNKKSKPTKSQLKLESEPFHQLISLSQQDQLVWIHLRLTSSTLWTFQLKSLRVKFKSPKTSRSAQLERKLKHLKPLFLKNLTWSPSNMVWKLPDAMTVDQFFLNKLSTLIQHHCWLISKQELRT